MKKQREKGLLKQVLIGMIGGLAGTWLMDKATTLMYRYESDGTKKREGELMREPAYTVLARRLAGAAGVALSDDRAARAGNVLHWSYGIGWGGLYGALYDRVPVFTKAAGLPYGAAVFAAGVSRCRSHERPCRTRRLCSDVGRGLPAFKKGCLTAC